MSLTTDIRGRIEREIKFCNFDLEFGNILKSAKFDFQCLRVGKYFSIFACYVFDRPETANLLIRIH